METSNVRDTSVYYNTIDPITFIKAQSKEIIDLKKELHCLKSNIDLINIHIEAIINIIAEVESGN